MSDFLQQVSSFLNLNKLVAITLPGIIATLALMLFFVPVPCPKDSQSCWYCMGVSKKEEVLEPKAGAAARPQGTYWVSKLSWEEANQSYKTLEKISQTNLTACAQLPEYIISSSRLKTGKETVKNLGDLVPVDPAALLENLDSCSSALTAAQTELNIKEAAQSNVIATLNESLKKLNTSLADATAALNSALERSLRAQVNEVRTRLEKQTALDSDLKSAANAAANLLTQVSDLRKPVTSDVGTAIPVETPTTWSAAMQALGSHILIFLLVSIMVGQLLDPLQRSIASSDPMRGLAFPLLNRLYRADQPIAGVRFGDQRYPGTRSPDIKPLLDKEPQLLEPGYAIGKGLLTQAEFNSLQDDFYRESQISTGLILPFAMLGLAIYIRLLCCGIVKPDHGEVWVCALLVLTVWFCLLAFPVQYCLGEEEECEREEKRERLEEKLKHLKEKCKRLGEQLQGPILPYGERKCLEKNRKRLEKQFERLQEKLQGLGEEGKPVRPETKYRDRRRKHRKIAGFVLSVAPLGVVIVWAWCARLFWPVVIALVCLLVLGVYHWVKARKSKRQQEERPEKECERVEGEGELPEGKRELPEGEGKRLKKERKRLEEDSKRRLAASFFVGIVSSLVLLVTLFVLASYAFLRNWPLVGLAVGLPTLEVVCFVAGIDRLHNFYSQVQARIVGAAEKQEDSQIKKFADLLTDPKAKLSFIDELKKRRHEINDILGPLTGEKP